MQVEVHIFVICPCRMVLPCRLISKSSKTVFLEGFSIFHLREPQLFKSSLKFCQIEESFVSSGNQIPTILSMYRL